MKLVALFFSSSFSCKLSCKEIKNLLIEELAVVVRFIGIEAYGRPTTADRKKFVLFRSERNFGGHCDNKKLKMFTNFVTLVGKSVVSSSATALYCEIRVNDGGEKMT